MEAPKVVCQRSYVFRALVVVLNDRRFLGTYLLYFVVHLMHFTIAFLLTFWWAYPIFLVLYTFNPMWFLFPFISFWDYLLLVEMFATWRTNVVTKGVKQALINVMLSEAGYSATVIRPKLPMFGLAISERDQFISFILNAPFAIVKLIYASFVSVFLFALYVFSPITRPLPLLLTAPSYGFYENDYYLTTIRRFPYYVARRYFTRNRPEFYNLGFSIALPRQFPFASFVFGYLEIFELALFAIDMERKRENHKPVYHSLPEQLCPLELSNGPEFKGFFYSKVSRDEAEILSRFHEEQRLS